MFMNDHIICLFFLLAVRIKLQQVYIGTVFKGKL